MFWKKKGADKPVSDLDGRFAALERRMRDLENDWNQTYEKFAKLNARLAKRAKRELEAVESELNAPSEAPTSLGLPPDASPAAIALLRGRRG